MRIGYFIPGQPGFVPNGIVTSVGRLGNHLHQQGHEVYFVYPDGKVCQGTNEIQIRKPDSLLTKLALKAHYNVSDSAAVYHYWKMKMLTEVIDTLSRKLDIFEMEETDGMPLSVIERSQAPVVVQAHGPWFIHAPIQAPHNDSKTNKARIAREGKAFRSAAGVLGPSNDVLERVKDYYTPLNQPSAAIVPGMTSSVRWKCEEADPNTILFVGRFDYHKGADILLKAFSEAVEHNHNLKLWFVGENRGLPVENGTILFCEYLKEHFDEELRQRIRYFGPLCRAEIDKMRTQAYLTIIPSRYETFGNTVLESISAGCPTIATNTGGIREIITHGRNGLLVASEDVMGLADAIGLLMESPELGIRLGNQGYEDCINSLEKSADKTLEFYEEVIESRK